MRYKSFSGSVRVLEYTLVFYLSESFPTRQWNFIFHILSCWCTLTWFCRRHGIPCSLLTPPARYQNISHQCHICQTWGVASKSHVFSWCFVFHRSSVTSTPTQFLIILVLTVRSGCWFFLLACIDIFFHIETKKSLQNLSSHFLLCHPAWWPGSFRAFHISFPRRKG